MKQSQVTPDEALFTVIINTCAQIGMICKCQFIVNQIPKNLLTKLYICCAFIDMWGKVGSINNAKKIFQSAREHDVIATTVMSNKFQFLFFLKFDLF
ncbi:unnamed protein product [Adineta ricciae]|uniref:Uncharacterized protein n=1 Tax=Adineta ricciae TaxID=249248 RepID=A0A814ZMT3_ADIRI|nr:unnamed protein product [Adineta ricciae]